MWAGPDSHVRVFDARSGQALTYGPQERAAVMAEATCSSRALSRSRGGGRAMTCWFRASSGVSPPLAGVHVMMPSQARGAGGRSA